jgi:hypothetical protein
MSNENKIQIVVEAYNMAKSTLDALGKQIKGIGDESTQAGQKHDSVFSKMKENWLTISVVAAEVAMAMREAWDVMAEGSKARQSEESFRSVAAAAGQSADKILEEMRRAANGTMDDSMIMQKAVKGMTQGLSGDQMVEVMKASRIAARVAGTDIQTAYEEITNAIANKMPRSLRQFGLVTKEQMQLLEASMAAGITSVDLYALAMANAADQSKKMGRAQEDAYEKIQKFNAQIAEIKETAGKGIYDYLVAPLLALTEKVATNVASAIIRIEALWNWAKSGFKGGIEEINKQLKTEEDRWKEEIAHINDKYYNTAKNAPKPGSAEFVGPVQPATNQSSAKALEAQMKAALAMKQREADIQKQINLVDIAEKEEDFSHVDSTRLRLALTQQLFETQQKNLAAIDKTSQGGAQAYAGKQKEMDETKKKISDLTLTLKEQQGTAAKGSDIWIKQQQAANAYAMALVDVEEKERSISKADAIEKRILLTRELIDLAEMEAAKVVNGSKEWSILRAQIEQLRGTLVDLKKDLAAQSNDLTAGLQKGFRDYLYEAQTTFQQAVKLSQETAQAMEQAFSDFFFDAMNGKLKNFSDYIKAFLQSIARAIANMMAQKSAAGIIGSINWGGSSSSSGTMTNSTTGSGDLQVAHDGGTVGYVPRFHAGGLNSDERMVINKVGERYITQEQNDWLTKIANSAQGQGGTNVVVNVENKSSQPVNAKQSGVRFDKELKAFVVGVILSDAENGGDISRTIQSLQGAR